jgi:predicted DCC family thiol-disulfide oxidoreductase YuxK
MKRNPQPLVIVYDGDCGFCRSQIARIRRRDRQGRFEYAAKQTPGLFERFPALEGMNLNSGLRVITPDSTIHVGPDAVYAIARKLPRWRWAAWLCRVPGVHALLRGTYAWVASRRYSLNARCDDGACHAQNP